jgi:hypothetical protein
MFLYTEPCVLLWNDTSFPLIGRTSQGKRKRIRVSLHVLGEKAAGIRPVVLIN